MTRVLVSLALAAGSLIPVSQASAATAPAPHWYDDGAALPATVNLNDVAVDAATGVVIAVGQDTATQPPAPVVYRRVQGVWQADSVTGVPADAATATLTQVAIGGGQAWAVGTYAVGTGDTAVTHPLVVRFDGSDLTDTAVTAWSPAAGLPDALTHPTALALAPVAGSGGADGFVGDASGAIYRLQASSGLPVWSGASQVAAQTTPSFITDIAATAPQTGIAVAAATANNTPRFEGLAADSVDPTKTDATPQAAPTDLSQSIIGIAAAGSTAAVAIDSGRPWQQGSAGSWTRDTASTAFGLGAVLTDVTGYLDPASLTPTFAIAGGNAFGAAVWRRTGTAGWVLDNNGSADTLPGADPLSAVAIVSATDMWAVGSGGRVIHFWPKPLPPPTTSGDSGGMTGSTSSGGTTTDTTASANTQVTDPAAAGGPAPGDTGQSGSTAVQVVTTPPPANPAPPTHHRRRARATAVMSKVALRRVRGGLQLTFTLSAPARVAATAYMGKRVVASAKPTRFRRGAGSLLVPYRGKKPPTRLRIVVQPVAKKAPVAAPRTRGN